MKKLRLEEIVTKDYSNDLHDKVTKPKEIWKYFYKNTSFHGIQYWLDGNNLTRIDQILWKIIFFAGFFSAIYIVFLLYGNFQVNLNCTVIKICIMVY